MSDPQSIWSEMATVLRNILGIEPDSPEKPKPLKRLNKAQMQEATRLMQNKQAYDAMSKPGAMVLDAPAMPYLQPKDRKAFFEKYAVPYRQSGPATSDQLPPGTIITQPPKDWK